jgi:fucose 4-O-acetylase-like acetyltransferase
MTTQISLSAEGIQTLKTAGEKTAAAVRAGAKAAGRMLFVDNLRVFLTILVVLHHLAITYGASGDWSYTERPTTELTEIFLSLFTTLDHFFFMGLFFLISGYFIPGSLDRKGTWQFLKDRAVRLGIPFLVYGFLISPLTSYVWSVQHGQWSGNLWQFYARSVRNLEFNSGPLWFVEILLAFSAVYALGRAFQSWVKSRQRNRNAEAGSAEPKPLTHRTILAFILILAPLSFATRLFFPLDTSWHNLQFSMFPQYILLFAAGILACRRGWLPDLPSRIRKVWSTVAIVCIVILPLAMVLLGGGDEAGSDSGLSPLAMILATWEAVYCPSMAILLLSLFRSRLDFQGRLGRLFSQNAYTAYILHAPVIVGLAWMLRNISLYPLLKYLLVAPVAVGLCFLISHLVRRIPLAEKVL